MSATVPFDPPKGALLVHSPVGGPKRTIRFEGHLGGRLLHLVAVDDASGPYLVRTPGPDAPETMPTVEWAMGEVGTGRLHMLPTSEKTDPRAARFAGWDASACKARDPKAPWRAAWGRLANRAGVKRSKDRIEEWLPTAAGPDPKPGWRSLVRHMDTAAKLDRAARARGLPSSEDIAAFVNGSGRLPGQSQLPPVADDLVHLWATRFWENARIASMDDAAALMTADWFDLKAMGVAGLGDAPPSVQSVSQRIHSLRCRATVAARHGEAEARRLYGAVGEPVPVQSCFELVMMDGAQFRHAVLFAPDWEIESPQMKAVFAMDAKSQYVWDPPVFCGPFRPEMSMRAINNVMVCGMSEEEIAADPIRVGLHQPPRNLYFDNDKSLLPPGTIPNIANVVSSIATGTPYSPDEKGKLENFIKYVKHNLRGLPGQILGPRRRSDPRRDPIADASVDRLQYAAAVRTLVRRWNTHPKTSMGRRSPEQIMLAELG